MKNKIKRSFIAWVLLPTDKFMPLKPSKTWNYAYICLTKKALLSKGEIPRTLKATKVKVIEV